MEDTSEKSSIQAIHDIRNLMEKSARFLSLSGWSGIWAGLVALGGACCAHIIIQDYTDSGAQGPDDLRFKLILVAAIVFLVAVAGGIFFTLKKTKKQGQKVWNPISRKMLINLIIPLAAGGVFVMSFLYWNDLHYLVPTCLVFYGLSLINTSKYTLPDIRYLGLLEILLGALALFIVGYGLWFWTVGFGFLHIIYGIIMWRKYGE